MNKNDRNFIGYAIGECIKKGVNVILESSNYLEDDGERMLGYFNEGTKILSVATKVPFKVWMPLFVHEFSHFQQWKEKEKLFMKLTNNEKLDKDIWDWVKGENISETRAFKSIDAYMRMELDCEKRAYKNMEKFDLSINKSRYIKNANVYVLSYQAIKETRSWGIYFDQYTQSLLEDLVPDTFITDFELPKGFLEIIKSAM